MPRTITSETLKYLKEAGMKVPCNRKAPLWRGPLVDGITFSLLSRFLVDRERFRVLVVEGLKPIPTFNQRIDYGTLWHSCEEAWAKSDGTLWSHKLEMCAKDLCRRYPTQQEQVIHWTTVCGLQFPLYVKYWAEHSDVLNREPVLAEKTFRVPYKLPSGRTVTLLGKWDSVDYVEDSEGKGLWLQENKTKGDVDEIAISRQLSFDLQTMLYFVALYECGLTRVDHDDPDAPYTDLSTKSNIKGVRYNVIRRPLSGGRGTIRQKKGQTQTQFYEELRGIIHNDPAYYFIRYKVAISTKEIERFRRRCLDPILESLCDWWEWIRGHMDDPFSTIEPNKLHWQHPFGVYNILNEGGYTELDGYIADGSEVGLKRVSTLFPELENATES